MATSNPHLLRVACPSTRNTQQTPPIRATSPATVAQQGGLKALAIAALARNKPCNTGAQHPRKTAQYPPLGTPPLVATDSAPLRVARVAFPRDATTQQPRPVLHFRLKGYEPNCWATALGRPDETVESLRADLRDRWPDVETRL